MQLKENVLRLMCYYPTGPRLHLNASRETAVIASGGTGTCSQSRRRREERAEVRICPEIWHLEFQLPTPLVVRLLG